MEQIGVFWENIEIKIPRIPKELKLSTEVSSKSPQTYIVINHIDAPLLRILSYYQNKECPSSIPSSEDLDLEYRELMKRVDILKVNGSIKFFVEGRGIARQLTMEG